MKFVRGTGVAVAALLIAAACAGSASARGVVVEDWLGASGLGWQEGTATDFLGWSSGSSDGSFSFVQADGSGRGSLVAQAEFLPHQGPGTGEWRFAAPGTSTITKAEYGPAYFTKEGCLNEGMRLADGSWQATRNARGGAAEAASVHPTACGANATVTGAKVTTKDGSTAVTITGAPDAQTFCSTAGCGLEGSPTGNQAVFGAERIKQGRPGFGVVLPGARLTLTDYDAPKLVSGENSHPRWVRSAHGQVTVTATDTGLGVKSATVTHAALSGDATSSQTHPCAGNRTDRCPADWNSDRPDWVTTWPYDTDEMPEGIQPYGVAARDIVDNRTPGSGYDSSLVAPSKIDRSDPDQITGTGQIPDLDHTWFLGDDTRTITASAHDTYSGVQSLQIETTDGDVLDHATFDCTGDQCPRDVTKTLAVDTTKLPEGDTTVRLRATDLVGNTAVGRTWTLRIDRTDPITITGTGSLPDSDGIWTLGNDTRTVNATAHDTYSGIKTLALEATDGHTIDTKTFDCNAGKQCEHDDTATLALDLNTLPEGETHVRLRATDLLDHTDVGPTWTLRIDRTSPSATTASGGVVDLDGDYARSGTLGANVSATDALSGIRRLTIVDDDGAQVATTVVCGGRDCANSASGALAIDLGSLDEGAHTMHAQAMDAAGNTTDSEDWSIFIDRSAPGFPGSPVAALVDTDGAFIRWTAADDPDLPDGEQASGVETYRVRWVKGGAAGPWQDVDDSRLEGDDLPSGSYAIEVVAIDELGNASPAVSIPVRPLPVEDGALYREPDGTVYLVEDGLRAWVSSPAAADQNDLDLSTAAPIAEGALDGVPAGDSIDFQELDEADTPGADEVEVDLEGEVSTRGRSISASPGGTYKCTGPATIRNAPDTYAIGWCVPGTGPLGEDWTQTYIRVTAQDRSDRRWRHGNIEGAYNGCGWVRTTNRVDDTGHSTRAGRCVRRGPNENRFAKRVADNDCITAQCKGLREYEGKVPTYDLYFDRYDDPNDPRNQVGTHPRTTRDCPRYLNVDFNDKTGTKGYDKLNEKIPADTPVLWRYITRGKGFVMTSWDGDADHPSSHNWSFIPASCVRTPPTYQWLMLVEHAVSIDGEGRKYHKVIRHRVAVGSHKKFRVVRPALPHLSRRKP